MIQLEELRQLVEDETVAEEVLAFLGVRGLCEGSLDLFEGVA